MPKPMRVALYLRVSTDGQTVDNQRRELEAAAARHGWEVAAVFADEGISGSKGRDQRPGLDGLMKGVARREFDLVAAWSVDRLGRSLQGLVTLLAEIKAKRVGLYLHQQGLDTTTPAGEAMFGMLGVFAQFERAMIRERVNAGLARAKAQGVKLGRPSVPAKVAAGVRKARADGMTVRATAEKFGLSVGVVHKLATAA